MRLGFRIFLDITNIMGCSILSGDTTLFTMDPFVENHGIRSSELLFS